jgi:hypothetical protein
VAIFPQVARVSIRFTKPRFPPERGFRWNPTAISVFAYRVLRSTPWVARGVEAPDTNLSGAFSYVRQGEEACPRVIRRQNKASKASTVTPDEKKPHVRTGAFKEEERLKIRQPHKSTRRNGLGAIPSLSGRAFQGSAA